MPVHALTAAVKSDMNFIATYTIHTHICYLWPKDEMFFLNLEADYEDMSIYSQHFLRLPHKLVSKPMSVADF